MSPIPESQSFFHKSSTGTNIHYMQSGNPNGRVIVCLHGLGGSTATFRPLLPFLIGKADYNVICMDFEGLGKTALSSPDVELSIARYVRDLEDLVSSLQNSSPTESSKPIVLIGHSLGSIVSLHYAAKRPDNVSGLAVLGVGTSAAHIQAARDRMLGLAARVRKEGISSVANLAMTSNFPSGGVSQRVRDAVRDAVVASDPEGYAKTCEAIMNPDTHINPDYAKILCPVVFVSGESDPLSPVSRAVELQTLIGGGSILEIVGRGHQPILEDIRGVERAVEELLILL